MYNVAYLTDTGLVRDHNEDAILVSKEAGLMVVADGMGGHEKGEVASRKVVEAFLDFPLHIPYTSGNEEDTLVPSMNIDEVLNQRIEFATKQLIDYSEEKGITSVIGSTIVGAKHIPNLDAWALFHLGDSRAYLFRENSLLQLTTDHSKHEMLREQGKSEEDILRAGKNVITKAIGNFDPYALDIQYLQMVSGDILLLCSDGVSDFCSKDELLLLMIQYKSDLDFLCTQIKNLVYARGAKDNLSIVVIETV